MKKLSLFASLLLLIGNTFAQQDAKAKEILDKFSETTKTYQTIQIDFSFTLENIEEDIKESNTGSVALKDNFYRLNMPALGMEVFSNGKTSWTYLPDAEEVNVSENDPENDDALNPANLFSIYEKGFDYKTNGEITIAGKKAVVIELYPQNKERDFSKIELAIDKSKYHILRAKTFGKDGNLYIFEMTSMKTNEDLPDSYFIFNEKNYPNVDVIDMR